MPYLYLGDDVRIFTQYRDLVADTPLVAAPGGMFDMAPVGGLDLPVPPAGGLWGDEVPWPPPPPPTKKTKAAPTEGATDPAADVPVTTQPAE